MSNISKAIIEAVELHLNEYGDVDVVIPLRGDLETEIDAILLDATFSIAPDSNE